MEITTQFDIGDKVWNVWDRVRRETLPCSICGGAGKVPVVGVAELITCPKCFGKGETEGGEQFREYLVSHSPLTIGKVTVAIEGPCDGVGNRFYPVDMSNMGPRSRKTEETYMVEETGVGSGRVYHARDLFATREEAEDEARRRTQGAIDSILRYDEVEASA